MMKWLLNTFELSKRIGLLEEKLFRRISRLDSGILQYFIFQFIRYSSACILSSN